LRERIAEIKGSSLDATTVERAVAAGFDTLMLSDGETESLAQAALLKGALALWLVVSPDKTGMPVFSAHATPPIEPWLLDSESALDPRRPPQSFRLESVSDGDLVIGAWQSKLRSAVDAGVAGFVCRDGDRLPASFWTTLIGGFRDNMTAPRWIAWTPGLMPASVDALVASGFDTVCSSVAWWDGRGQWLADELQRAPSACKLAFPSDPFGLTTDEKALLPIAQRLRLAAVLGDALLVPQALWTDVDCTPINRWFAAHADGPSGAVRFASGPDSQISAFVKTPQYDLRASDHATVVLLNPDGQHAGSLAGSIVTGAVSGFGRFDEILASSGDGAMTIDPCSTIKLEAAAMHVFTAQRLPSVKLATGRRSADAAIDKPRLAIEAIMPSVDNGRFPVKRTAGEAVRVEADILIDGHEKLAAVVLYRAAGERAWREVRMEALVNDRYGASFALPRVGRHEFTIEAWRDVFATYRNEIDKKFAAGLDVSLELTEGRLLIEDALANARTLKKSDIVRRLTTLLQTLSRDAAGDRAEMATQVAGLLASQTLADMQKADRRAFATRPDVTFPVDAERSQASFASWYELFPRSLGNPPGAVATHHGTFDDVIDRLPAVRAMGFDVLYFPPIHPIGERNRKGRNNSLTTVEGDPGSPYAIGSADGGHDALHPQLGTFEDFKRLRDAALDHGLELALDFAIQCSPDHPWLKDHPGWFAWRPDGSLRYAENPPKKYEDIVNVEFYGHGRGGAKSGDSAPALWNALRDVILVWVEHGVRIFRVDNPHTKPLPFWEWMIAEVRAKYPDTIFLSEAFTRPKLMYRLAKVGFSQSYTYFTWRHTKQEFIDYLTELTGPESRESLHAAPRDFFRPNFFVNTPDINPVFLQRSGRAGFLIRAALASMLSGLWGVYSGFELCEGTPVPGKEDYLDSEKYQLRAWDWQRPGNIVAEISALNRIRNENPALRTHLNVRFQNVFDPNILYFTKATEDRSNVVVVAINLDPYGVHEADFELPLWEWGRSDDAAVEATDLLDGHRFRWHGKTQRMRLDPGINPYAVWRVTL
jgi:starch synthase (maltosyl-transferring)